MRTYLDIQDEALIISVAQPGGHIENATKGDKWMTHVRNALKFPSSMIVSIDATSVLCIMLDAKDSRENEDLPEDRDQCRRQTGKQRSEEEEQEGMEVRRRCDDGGVQYMARPRPPLPPPPPPKKNKIKNRAFNTAVIKIEPCLQSLNSNML